MSVPSLAGKGAGKGGDEGVDTMHTTVHLLDSVSLNSRNLLHLGPSHCNSKALLVGSHKWHEVNKFLCFHVKIHVFM